MFNIQEKRKKAKAMPAGEKTRALILEKALELFRRKGFEQATMREVARAAKAATGAAYYYFPSKEAIVFDYYDYVQRIHLERVRAELTGKQGLRERLGIVIHGKLEILKNDRMLLGGLFRFTGEPGHPLSVFGKGTEAQRQQSAGIFREAIAGTDLSPELRELLTWSMWLAHLGIILFFIYDESEGQKRTHKLVDGVVALVTGLVELTNSALVRPFVKPFQEGVLGMLREAGLWKES